ncbi:hypothetical protein [Aquisphaera insulae]|uniref:hypothetical protein n=1 Tax=Aquisphaera insulae TaxID=2712864 RepID=UPI0013EA7E10
MAGVLVGGSWGLRFESGRKGFCIHRLLESGRDRILEFHVGERFPLLRAIEQDEHADVLLGFFREQSQIAPDLIVSLNPTHPSERRIDDPDPDGDRILPVKIDGSSGVIGLILSKDADDLIKDLIGLASEEPDAHFTTCLSPIG